MPDYQKMYATLYGSVSDALDVLPDTPHNEKTRFLLEQAMAKTEDIYINAADGDTAK